MILFILFEVLLAISETVTFARVVYQKLDKRKKIKKNILLLVFLVLWIVFVIFLIIVSWFCTITLSETFEIQKFVSAYLVFISMALLIFLLITFGIMPCAAKRKSYRNFLNEEEEEEKANEYV